MTVSLEEGATKQRSRDRKERSENLNPGPLGRKKKNDEGKQIGGGENSSLVLKGTDVIVCVEQASRKGPSGEGGGGICPQSTKSWRGKIGICTDKSKGGGDYHSSPPSNNWELKAAGARSPHPKRFRGSGGGEGKTGAQRGLRDHGGEKWTKRRNGQGGSTI